MRFLIAKPQTDLGEYTYETCDCGDSLQFGHFGLYCETEYFLLGCGTPNGMKGGSAFGIVKSLISQFSLQYSLFNDLRLFLTSSHVFIHFFDTCLPTRIPAKH